jgi:hypothetical protein
MTGERWYINDSLGRAFTIQEAGDFLVIKNNLFESKLTAVSFLDPTQIYHFGKPGEGPNELINFGPILTSPEHIEVYDGAKMTLIEFDLNGIGGDAELTGNPLFRTKLSGIISMVKLSDEYYLASGIFPEGRLCLMDKEGNIHSYLGTYPIQGDAAKELPFHILGMAYQSLMCKQDNGNRVALATRYAETMQIYEWDPLTQTVNDVRLISNSSPMFTTADINGTPNFSPDKDTRWGYIDVDASDKYIYALYSGRLQSQDNMFYAGNQIHVFDWDGNAIYQLHLDDHEGTSLAVKGDKLFIITEDEEIGYDIVEYSMSFN